MTMMTNEENKQGIPAVSATISFAFPASDDHVQALPREQCITRLKWNCCFLIIGTRVIVGQNHTSEDERIAVALHRRVHVLRALS